MLRTMWWYFVGMTCVLGVIAAIGTMSFLTLLVFRNYLAWNWFIDPVLSGMG